ncbi:MAG: hypothetical protein QGI25_13890 [Arenicellales bacterium]|jgi:hypothetical protein|nr:hypothetical protein [Arenicellales bacterium]
MDLPVCRFIYIPVCLVLILNGCTSLRPLPGVDDTTIRASVNAGDKVSVVRKDGSARSLKVVRIDGDTLIGEVREGQIQIPLSDIKEMKTREFSIGRTVGLTAGLLFVGGLIEVMTSESEPGCIGITCL